MNCIRHRISLVVAMNVALVAFIVDTCIILASSGNDKFVVDKYLSGESSINFFVFSLNFVLNKASYIK